MPLTVFLVLALAAFLCTLAAVRELVPLWVGVVLLCILELLRVLPLGK